MSSLQQQVRRTIVRHGLCPPRSRVLAGVSGGSDSVALTLLLLELAEHDGFTVAGLAHLNHQLRSSAARDEAFCREFASSVRLPIVVEAASAHEYAEEQHLSLEDAARRIRYDFLGRAARELTADRVAVGHTQDDQAETFLLKLMRGAGMTGLGGIYPRRDAVVRPLLDVSRADLRAYLVARGQAWVEDETNDDLDNPRNRVRHVVLGELDRAADGPTRPAIARAAALVREDGQWLDEFSERRFRSLATETPDGLEFDTQELLAEPRPVARRLLLWALRRVGRGREVGLEHVEAVLERLRTAEAGGIDLPGSRVELRRGKVVLVQKSGVK